MTTVFTLNKSLFCVLVMEKANYAQYKKKNNTYLQVPAKLFFFTVLVNSSCRLSVWALDKWF